MPTNLPCIDNEIWRPIIGYEDLYAVSNMGRVKSFDSLKKHNYGGARRVCGNILKPDVGTAGYYRVTLYIDNKPTKFLVHRLVALHFIDNDQNKPEVNHKYGIKSDNRASELEWSTPKENTIHAIGLGIRRKPKGLGVSNITKEDIDSIFSQKKMGLNQYQIAAKMNTGQNIISMVLNKKITA